MARARVTGDGVEVFYLEPTTEAKVTTYGIEVFLTWAAASPTTITGVGVTQYGVEVFYSPPSEKVYVNQHGVEVFYTEPADVETAGGGETSGAWVA